MEIERKWLIDGFPAGLPLLKEARVRQGYISTAPVVRIRESVNADGCRCVLWVYALPGGERLEVSLVDAGRPTAFFYAEVEFPTVEAARAFVPPPFLGEEKTESGDFSMSAYWHATRGSGREG